MKKQIKITSKNNYLQEALGSTGVFEINDDAKLEIVDDGKQVFVGSEVMQKPMVLKSLVANIISALTPEKIEFKSFILLPKLRKIVVDNMDLQLTEKETAIILFLLDQPDNKSNKVEMLSQIWGVTEDTETKTLESHIYRLRQKLETVNMQEIIRTEADNYVLNI